MAENEVKKENKSASMSIWFLVFVIYLIGSLAYIFMLKNDLTTLEATKQEEIQTLQTSNYELTSKLYKVNSNLETIYNLLSETRIDLDSVLSSNSGDEVTDSIELSIGTYTGTATTVSGDDTMEVSMTLTLAEDNMATLVNNDVTVEGVFVVSENAVMFTSNDGLTTASFEVLEDGNLKLVDNNVELTLSK